MGNSFVLDVAEVVSSYHAIKTGKSVVASAQELVDCCTSSYSDFVDSDTTFTAPELADIWKCIVNLGGLCSKADYHTGNPCGSSQCQPVANVRTFFFKLFPFESTPSSIENPRSSSKIKQSIENPRSSNQSRKLRSSSKIKQSIKKANIKQQNQAINKTRLRFNHVRDCPGENQALCVNFSIKSSNQWAE